MLDDIDTVKFLPVYILDHTLQSAGLIEPTSLECQTASVVQPIEYWILPQLIRHQES